MYHIIVSRCVYNKFENEKKKKIENITKKNKNTYSDACVQTKSLTARRLSHPTDDDKLNGTTTNQLENKTKQNQIMNTRSQRHIYVEVHKRHANKRNAIVMKFNMKMHASNPTEFELLFLF